MLRLAFSALAHAESSPDFLEIVTPAEDDTGADPPSLTNVVESSTFVSFAIHSIHDDEGEAGFETGVDPLRNHLIGLVADATVSRDVDCESLRELHPLREHDAELLVDVATPDQQTADFSVQTCGSRGLPGCGQS